jgi:hypothetical protein
MEEIKYTTALPLNYVDNGKGTGDRAPASSKGRAQTSS